MQDEVRVYFDTMLYLNKFGDPYKLRQETINMFNKVKNGKFRLIVSQTVMMEIYHVLCLPIEKTNNFEEASQIMSEAKTIKNKIKQSMLSFPNTEFAEKEFDGIKPENLSDFVENVPGSNLIDFCGKKLPGSMDFIHLMIALNLRCEQFFTEDKGVLNLNSYNQKGNMKIIKPYRS